MRLILTLLLMTLAVPVRSECYVVESMAGFIAANAESYRITSDGMQGRK